MRNLKLKIEYIGTNYIGWQRQARDNDKSIQAIIEKSISQIIQEEVKLIAAGRTDSGVHAKGQVANFTTNSSIEPQRLKKSLNAILPPDIRIYSLKEVPLSFHARKSARSKVYKYFLFNGEKPPVFMLNWVWHYPYQLDLENVKKASSRFIGKHDFSFFQVKGREVLNPVREVYYADIIKKGHLLIFSIEADGFLYKMVRVIMGTLVNIGRGKFPTEIIEFLLQGKSKNIKKFTAPAKGLILWKVKY